MGRVLTTVEMVIPWTVQNNFHIESSLDVLIHCKVSLFIHSHRNDLIVF